MVSISGLSLFSGIWYLVSGLNKLSLVSTVSLQSFDPLFSGLTESLWSILYGSESCQQWTSQLTIILFSLAPFGFGSKSLGQTTETHNII